jgi:porphobilinogen synthase
MGKDMAGFPYMRLRRLRQNATLRDLVQEVHLDIRKFILPLFIKHGTNIKKPIASMPGHFQLSIDNLEEEIKTITVLGIQAVILFGIPEKKDPLGSDAYADDGIIQRAIPVIRKAAPNLLIICDNCFCEYTDHGHCGVIDKTRQGEADVNNDETLKLLAKQVVSHARAGADVIAPSGNMDGMALTIRRALDEANFEHIPILSYTIKYASAMYGPFREAAEGAPKFGDRRTYQMNFANGRDVLHEAALDVMEGTDMLMVKPAHTYLDIIYRVKQAHPNFPLGAYHTSGEFAMLKAASQNGWIDERKSVLEVSTAIQRAGADFIISYYAKEIATWLS